MKKIIFILILTFSVKSSLAQNELNEQKCYWYKTEYSYESPEWGIQHNYDVPHGPYTIHECLRQVMAVKTGKRMINSIVKIWDETKVTMHCTCEEDNKSSSHKNSGKNTESKKNKTPSSSSSSQQPRKTLTPAQAYPINTFTDAVENKKDNLLQQNNSQNEKDANKFEGGRPSSEKAYNLPELYGSSDKNTKKEETNNAKVIEFDSDDDGVVDTRVTTKPGEAPVYEKISNERPTAAENYDLTELKNGSKLYKANDNNFDASAISNLSEIAESLGNNSYNLAGKASDAFTDLNDLKSLKDFYDNPKNEENTIEAMNIVGSRMASALSKMSGLMYDKFTAPIPALQNSVMNSSLEQASSLLENGTYDEREVWRSVGNYFGNTIGMGNVGDKAKDFTTEGDKSWGQLKSQYGFVEGTKKSIWYYLLNDLKNKSQ